MYRIFALLGVLLLLPGCGGMESSTRAADLFANQQGSDRAIVTSQVDDREYRYLHLPNELKVILISDMEADKAAASLSVSVGSAQDPEDREGLAHFLEHMLFLGTDRFPDPGEYQAYISAHGGSHNAYTAYEETNYFFDINPDAFEGGLERFSRFFVAPLFNEQYVEREKNAVHSEYSAKIKNDYRRRLDALREVINPQHPAAKFRVGNLSTLADRTDTSGRESKVQDDLLAFYRQHYSANRMTLAVAAPLPLSELETLVKARFSAVQNHQTRLPEQTQPVFLPAELPAQLNIKPERELRKLEVLFPLPSVEAYYREKPLNYIGNLLGHEGPGSLLSLLKAKGWAEGLSAGVELDDRRNSLFQVAIQLTDAGLHHRREIQALLFEQIAQIRKQGIEHWRFDEQAALAAMQFRFKEKTTPVHHVRQLATNLHLYPVADVMQGAYRMDRFDPQMIQRFLAAMTADNALTIFTAPNAETDQVTELYAVPYKIIRQQAAGSAVLDESETALLKLPAPNPFVPSDFKLVTAADTLPQERIPTLLLNDERQRVWYYPAGEGSLYPVPKAQLYVSIKTPATKSAQGAALTDFYLRLVDEQLNETSYQAVLAGLGYNLGRSEDGVVIAVSGFNDKLPAFTDVVAKAVFAGKWNADHFERIRLELLRDLRNSAKEPPFRQVWRELLTAMQPEQFSAEQLAAALEQITPRELKTFADNLFDGAVLELLASGNLTESEVNQLSAGIEKRLSSKNGQWHMMSARPVVQLSSGERLQLSLPVDHPDTAVIRYYQGLEDSLTEQAGLLLLRQLIKAPFFNSLRTEQQLGYVVAAVDTSLQRVPGFGLLVQSPVADRAAINKAIDEFLQQFEKRLVEMPAAEFEQYRQGLLASLREKPKNLSEQSGRFWGSIGLRYWQFDSRERLIKQVEAATQQQIQRLYRERIFDAPRSIEVATGSATNAVVESSGSYFILPPYSQHKAE